MAARIRKIKSGGGRVVYYAVASADRLFLLTAYAKAEQADLSPDDRAAIRRIVETIRSETGEDDG